MWQLLPFSNPDARKQARDPGKATTTSFSYHFGKKKTSFFERFDLSRSDLPGCFSWSFRKEIPTLRRSSNSVGALRSHNVGERK